MNLAFNVGNGAGQTVAPIDPRTGVRMTHDAWQRYFAEFMEQLRAELPASAEIVQNQVYFHVGLSSPYVKRAIEAATYLEIERGVNDTGLRGGTGNSASRPSWPGSTTRTRAARASYTTCRRTGVASTRSPPTW